MVATREPVDMTASEMVAAVRSRQISRRELLQAQLDRIAATNPQVNALVELQMEAALAEADAADRDHAQRAGLPLDGVPVSIKEHFDVAGMRHTEGVASLAERRSPDDAVAVARLRAAGAIILGKGNQPELQIRWNTLNDLYGPTRNPRDPRLAPGGSSGGEAAAVAAGMVPIGLGLDAGGSIRQPAACCGVYGLRTSPGRIPYVNVLEPIDPPPSLEVMGTIGPLARSVDDLELALRAMAGPHPADPSSVPVSLHERTGRPVRVARMISQAGAIVEPEIEARVDQATAVLQAAGYEVVEVDIPGAARAPDIWRQLRGTELMHLAMPHWRPLLSAIALGHIDRLFDRFAGETAMRDYGEALVERRAIARQTAVFMEDHPLILAPVAGMPVPAFEFDHFLASDGMEALFARHRNLVWVNALGLPAVALPSGVQLIARRFREDQALDAAAVLEQAAGPCLPGAPQHLTTPRVFLSVAE